jgi:hypothetical protein
MQSRRSRIIILVDIVPVGPRTHGSRPPAVHNNRAAGRARAAIRLS